MVGYLMMRLVARIDWAAPENALPAFLIIAGIPLTFSIAAGIGFGDHRLRGRHGRPRQGARDLDADVGPSCRSSSPTSWRTGSSVDVFSPRYVQQKTSIRMPSGSKAKNA